MNGLIVGFDIDCEPTLLKSPKTTTLSLDLLFKIYSVSKRLAWCLLVVSSPVSFALYESSPQHL